MASPRIVFVLSPHQNAFFPEVADVLARELHGQGLEALITTEPGEHSVEDDDVFVLLPPHEYCVLEGAAFVEDETVAARTIGVSAEQPHQTFFEINARLGSRLGAVLDFSPLAVEAYRNAGVAARHLRFGYTPSWDHFRPTGVEATEPVLYLGNRHPRRLAVLSEAAEELARCGARLLISDNSAPNRTTGLAFVAGTAKRELLASTRLLVNIHQSDTSYFEWLRFAEAAHCGTPVLSEATDTTDPFAAGVHFESFRRHDLASRLSALVSDAARLDELRHNAYDTLRSHPLADSVALLIDTATQLLTAPPPRSLPGRTRSLPLDADRLPVAPQHQAPRTQRPRLRPIARRRSRAVNASRELAAAWHALHPASVVVTPSDPWWHAPKLRGVRHVVIAPAGTYPLAHGVERLAEALGDGFRMVTAVLAGCDGAGEPTLEGIWPWQTWRLLHGQHLGRLMITDAQLVRDAEQWLADPRWAGAPHVALAAWAADHAIEVRHLAVPIARTDSTPLDAGQAASPTATLACQALLATGTRPRESAAVHGSTPDSPWTR